MRDESRRERRLFEFGDRLVDDMTEVPGDELESTMAMAHVALLNAFIGKGPFPEQTKQQIWEDLMSQRNVSLDRTSEPTMSIQVESRGSIVGRVKVSGSWQTAISFVAVMVFLAGLVGVAYQRGQSNGGGSPKEDRQTLAALGGQSGTAFEYREPMEEDCSVEPLTVDEVMAKLQYVDGHPVAGATPIPQNSLPQKIDEEFFNGLAAAQHEWLACSVYGSKFQVWALETNGFLQRELERLAYPFFSMESIRNALQELWDTGGGGLSGLVDTQIMNFEPDFADYYLPMTGTFTDQEPNAWYSYGEAKIDVRWVKPDGTLLADGPMQGLSEIEQRLPILWVYVKDSVTGEWLLSSWHMPSG